MLSNFSLEENNYLERQLNKLLSRLNADVADITEPFIPKLLAAHQQGDSCLRLNAIEANQLAKAAPLVGKAGLVAPLILEKFAEKNYLYFAKHWLLEQQLARRLVHLASQEEQLEAASARAILDKFFHENSMQRVAAALALRKHLLIINGGPGTGKTSTVIRLIAALVERNAQKNAKCLNIALAAPTGKAAARLSETLRNRVAQLGLSEELAKQIPSKALTLHRLLGLYQGRSSSRFNADNPLPLDILIIDEASMIDLQLMTQTLNAITPNARLILLGDPQQLASVNLGSVLSDLCGFESYSAKMLNWLQQVCGQQNLNHSEDLMPLSDCLVTLQESHRFGADSGIGQLAQAVKGKNSKAALELFDNLLQPDITWAPARGRLAAAALQLWQPYFAALEHGAAAAFAAFAKFMLLCVEKKDVEEINLQISQLLEKCARKSAYQDWYAGRAVMVRENDYSLNLFNGDIGLTLQTNNGLQVYFPEQQGGYRAIPIARLNNISSAFAMTVHKSQGSEFEQVWLLLPNDKPLTDRALIYTAITRAKTSFAICCANAEELSKAILRQNQRISGLSAQIFREIKTGVKQSKICYS